MSGAHFQTSDKNTEKTEHDILNVKPTYLFKLWQETECSMTPWLKVRNLLREKKVIWALTERVVQWF